MNRTASQRETIGETEDEAERKRQELLQLQKRSRLARLAEKRDPNALADIKRNSGETSDLPLGMALTERSNRLLKLEKQKKKALHESENLRQQLKDMKSKNDTLDRQLSKERLDRSKSKSKQSSPVKTPRKTPEKQPQPVQQNIDDQLIKKIESLQGHIKDAYRQSSLDKHKKDKECEKLRENLWMAKAEEEGLKRRLDKAERQLAEERELADEAEKLRRMQERSPQHLRHASADEGTDDDLSVGHILLSQKKRRRED